MKAWSSDPKSTWVELSVQMFGLDRRRWSWRAFSPNRQKESCEKQAMVAGGCAGGRMGWWGGWVGGPDRVKGVGVGCEGYDQASASGSDAAMSVDERLWQRGRERRSTDRGEESQAGDGNQDGGAHRNRTTHRNSCTTLQTHTQMHII